MLTTQLVDTRDFDFDVYFSKTSARMRTLVEWLPSIITLATALPTNNNNPLVSSSKQATTHVNANEQRLRIRRCYILNP